ncbi:hypothetical protein CF326_g6085, partial [Tilletia indica]
MHGSMVPAFDTSRPSHFGSAGQTTSIGKNLPLLSNSALIWAVLADNHSLFFSYFSSQVRGLDLMMIGQLDQETSNKEPKAKATKDQRTVSIKHIQAKPPRGEHVGLVIPNS